MINFFEKHSTNAASESFNAKIKSFRSQLRGVKDKAFFLFRLAKIYARPKIPQAVPWLQEFSRKRKLSLAGTCLKPTYPVQRKKKRVPALQLSEFSVAYGHKKRSRSVVAAGPLQDG
ncbi:transposase, partial [uncultured Bacteroides sp.]|uniref:transposase n=1 Tax=uncultured Bacteroides sp. TaxID=162156 RepID=UPI00349F211B